MWRRSRVIVFSCVISDSHLYKSAISIIPFLALWLTGLYQSNQTMPINPLIFHSQVDKGNTVFVYCFILKGHALFHQWTWALPFPAFVWGTFAVGISVDAFQNLNLCDYLRACKRLVPNQTWLDHPPLFLERPVLFPSIFLWWEDTAICLVYLCDITCRWKNNDFSMKPINCCQTT